MLIALLIPLYYTVGDRRGSALQTFLLRSLGELFAMYLTMGLLFVPKLIYVMRAVRHGEQAEGQQSNFAAASRASMTGETTVTGAAVRSVPNYTEFSESDASDEDYEGAGIAGVSAVEDASRGPQFVSENVTRGSTTMDSGALASGGSGTAPTSFIGDSGMPSEGSGFGASTTAAGTPDRRKDTFNF